MGWSGGAVTTLAEDIKACGFQLLDGYELRYVPTQDELYKCYELGKLVGSQIKTM
jgi:flavorubredoxin